MSIYRHGIHRHGLNGHGLALVLLLLAAGLSAGAESPAESPNLGRPVTPAELAAVELTVFSDGQGLPPGSGDAIRGAALYQERCLACHGARGEDGINDRLAGGRGSIGTDAPVITVGSFWPYATTLFDYVRRAMPYIAPGSLSADEVYSLSAYILFLNGVVGEREVIDAESLPRVEMPNADKFIWAEPLVHLQ